MRLLDHFISEPRECSYLPEEEASLEYRVMLGISPEDLEELLSRGWRRFGPAYFRPKCRCCSECRPIRVPVDHFQPSKGQRRARNRMGRLRLELGRPQVDQARVRVYMAWQANRGALRGWAYDGITEDRYAREFAFPHPSALELAWYDEAPGGEGRRLVAVSLVDETPLGLSAVYTYFDPDYAQYSPGTGSVVTQIELARELGKRWVYLGYRVLGCPSSRYKALFRPHQLLEGWPSFEERPVWR